MEERLWYKDAVVYQLHVRAFFDGNSDGIGDFEGLRQKLDYLQDLGVTAIWLLPFYPSPLRDDGYDIADYTNVHSDYGTLASFRAFVQEAHRRGLRVITELVLNHTSDQHAWFQAARKAPPGSAKRDLYVWSDRPDRYADARIIFKDSEPSNWSWDAVARAYYWHRFFSHQPDLNFANPAVRKAVFRILDFWVRMGVDGFRLDAIPYLFEREGTSCENLPETHEFLKQLRRHVDRSYPDRMLLAEANQWPEDAIAYFGEGDECHMTFHFPLMPRMYMGLHMEDRYPIVDILEQTPRIPDGCQWAIFLRNHDELTLEMVTDEERDYMYRAYAQEPRMRINVGIRRRLAPLMENSRRKIELLNALLMSMPGTPIIYYGDELGMGDNIFLGDRNGVRTPFQWSPDRNAGFSRANPQRLYLPVITDPEYHFEAINVETQQNNPQSLLWWMKRLIALRKRRPALARGDIRFLHPERQHVLAFLRRYGRECILVVANLSRFCQYVELDLREFAGHQPIELFGHMTFPAIGELPYLLTLGPHSFYWFELTPAAELEIALPDQPPAPPAIRLSGSWDRLPIPATTEALEPHLPEYLSRCRWFSAKSRAIARAKIILCAPLRFDDFVAYLTLVRVEFRRGDPLAFVVPLAFAEGAQAACVETEHGWSVIARATLEEASGCRSGLIHDASVDRRFALAVLSCLQQRRRIKCAGGEIKAFATDVLHDRLAGAAEPPPAAIVAGEQSNTSMVFGDRLIAKIYRQVHPGPNPDLEVGRFLSRSAEMIAPPLAGWVEYRPLRGESCTLAVIQAFVPNEGDAWRFTLHQLRGYFDRVLAADQPLSAGNTCVRRLFAMVDEEAPDEAARLIGPFLSSVSLLGQRTARMHRELSRETDDPIFASEPFLPLQRRSVYQSIRNLANQVFAMLEEGWNSLPDDVKDMTRSALVLRDAALARARELVPVASPGRCIRTHGDYHLGQVLYTGKDFVIIDFEGEPARSISERRLKRPPLRDVAGMLRSFDYAARTALWEYLESGLVGEARRGELESATTCWYIWVAAAFLRAYRDEVAESPVFPRSMEGAATLLEAFLIEKVLYEIRYELDNRPAWLRIPLGGLLSLLSATEAVA